MTQEYPACGADLVLLCWAAWQSDDSELPAKETEAINKDGRKAEQAQHNAEVFLLLGLVPSSWSFTGHILAAISMAAPGITNIQVAYALCRAVS